MGPIGIPELIIVLVILLVIFGPKRLPGLGRSLGSGMREFKDSVTGKAGGDHDDDDERPALEKHAASSTPVATTEPRTTADERVTEPRA